MELKQKVVKGVAWSTVEKILSAVMHFFVSLVLLNLLNPTDYGIIAIVVAFTAIIMPIVDGGFSQALIREKSVDDLDYSSIFYLNIGIAFSFYVILTLLTPTIADFFNVPIFRTIAPVLFLLIPISAFSNIQGVIFARNLDFKQLSFYTLLATLISSGVAIFMAVRGYGVWALVAQRLFLVTTKTILLWVGSKWRPKFQFSLDSIKSKFRYGSRTLLANMISNIYYQISVLAIGKMYTKADLGYYDRGHKIKDLPVNSTISAVLSVTFPALSQLKDDKEKQTESARKVYIIWAFVMLPLIAILISISEDMFRVFLPEIWLPTVPYLQILSIAGFLSPLSVISYNLVKVNSDGKMIFRIEIIKKVFATIVLVVTIPISILAIAWGQVAIFVSDMLINAIAARRFLDSWSLWKRLKDIVPTALITLVMVCAIYGVGFLFSSLALWLVFAIKILTAILVYVGLSHLFRVEAWRDLLEILKGYFRSRK